MHFATEQDCAVSGAGNRSNVLPALHLPFRALALLVDSIVDNFGCTIGRTASDLFTELASGTVTTSPFLELQLQLWHGRAVAIFCAHGFAAGLRPNDRKQLIHVRLVQEILQAGGDPDSDCMDHFGRGVKLGVDCRLPRTPAVYERKVRWSLKDQATADAHARTSVEGTWRSNYRTAHKHQDWVAEQLDGHRATCASSCQPRKLKRATRTSR